LSDALSNLHLNKQPMHCLLQFAILDNSFDNLATLNNHRRRPIGEPTAHGFDIEKERAGAIASSNIKIIVKLVIDFVIIKSLLSNIANGVISDVEQRRRA
jgi:hypothetical protein